MDDSIFLMDYPLIEIIGRLTLRPDLDAIKAQSVVEIGVHQRQRQRRRVGGEQGLPVQQIGGGFQRVVGPGQAIDRQADLPGARSQ